MGGGNRLDRVFVALDGMSDREVCAFIEGTPQLTHYKVGLELYLRYGRPLVEHLVSEYGIKIFLDLKLHDIPNTVERALHSLSGLDIHFLTLHLAGGEAMARGAVRVAKNSFAQLKLLGVSSLTSLEWDEGPSVSALASKVDLWGLHGLVCAAQDLEKLAESKALKICPGIRFPGDAPGDQKRVATPEQALAWGADYLVIGRSLTQSDDLKGRLEQLAHL